MYRKYLFIAGLLLLLSAGGAAVSGDFFAHYDRVIKQTAATGAGVLVSPVEIKAAPPEYFSLVTEPAAGVAPVLALIQNAQKSIDLVMYQLDDQAVVQALAAAQARGVAVRVMLNGGYYAKKEKGNDGAYAALQKVNVSVKWTPTYFALTHQKTIIVDGSEAFIMTFNLVQKYYATGRDFGVHDTDPADVRAIEEAFNSDWEGSGAIAKEGDDLVWSPGSEDELLYLINSATSSLKIYNEEMADADITAALVAAARRGVHVQVVMTYATNWKKAFMELQAAGVGVRTFPSTKGKLYIHAKMIMVDNTTAFLGSENFSNNSMSKNRELGLVLSAPAVIASLQATFTTDWAAARPFTMTK
ncbi:MAG: phospholipase D-like domain-containing protein [Candidatus Adlerbacteria bacterium]|nr:phospholipase D-like domain-containing protein [Candidatus Adlerbacteria bacterium]